MCFHGLIVHIFLLGRLYDKCGNKREWWTNSSIAEFNEKTQCFVQQYSEYNMFGYHVSVFLSVYVCVLVCMHVCCAMPCRARLCVSACAHACK